jgi:hypothetical protein
MSELYNRRRQAGMQWLQDPSEINVDNLNNVNISGIKRGNI